MSLDVRTLRRRLAPWVPERLKGPLRGRLFGYRASAAALPVTFGRDAIGPIARIADRVTLRFCDEDTGDVRYQFVENGAAVDEAAGFLRVAAAARTLVDVGAWKGLFSILFCGLGDGRRAIAYEPSPIGGDALARLMRRNDCTDAVIVRPVALGAAAGRAPLAIAPNGIMAIADDDRGAGAAGVAVLSLDADCAALGVTPDLIKIDVEGYEHEVLVGARELLSRAKPTICLELHLDLLERRRRSAAMVVDELARHEYAFSAPTGRPLSRAQICGSPNAVLRLIAS